MWKICGSSPGNLRLFERSPRAHVAFHLHLAARECAGIFASCHGPEALQIFCTEKAVNCHSLAASPLKIIYISWYPARQAWEEMVRSPVNPLLARRAVSCAGFGGSIVDFTAVRMVKATLGRWNCPSPLDTFDRWSFWSTNRTQSGPISSVLYIEAIYYRIWSNLIQFNPV